MFKRKQKKEKMKTALQKQIGKYLRKLKEGKYLSKRRKNKSDH